MKAPKRIEARPQPDGDGHQVTYYEGDSRKVYRYPVRESDREIPPHGAGSFHDPDQHHELMERVEDYLRSAT